jgi:hypothetical protein
MTYTLLFPKSSPTLRQAATLLVCVTLCLGAIAPGAEARKPKEYGLIFGTVWGPDQKPVFGVRVKIRRATEKKAQ